MELTAKEILNKITCNRMRELTEERALAAMNEAVDLSYRQGWADRDQNDANDCSVSLKEDWLEEHINSLFPESKVLYDLKSHPFPDMTYPPLDDSGLVVSNGITSTE